MASSGPVAAKSPRSRAPRIGRNAANPKTIMNKNDSTNAPVLPEDSWQTKEVIDHAKQELQSHFSDVKDAIKQTANEVQAAAATTATVAREGYQAIRHDTAAHCVSYRDHLAWQIREQPLKSLGLAALGGLVFGLLVRK